MYHCCDMLGSWHAFMTSRSSILSRKQCTTSTKRGHMNIAFTIALFISHLRSPSTHLQRSNKMDTQLSSPPSHPVVDKKYILFQYVLPFIRARYNRRVQEYYQKLEQEQEKDPSYIHNLVGLKLGDPEIPRILSECASLGVLPYRQVRREFGMKVYWSLWVTKLYGNRETTGWFEARWPSVTTYLSKNIKSARESSGTANSLGRIGHVCLHRLTLLTYQPLL